MQYVRFRVDLGPGCSIGPGKIELLEAIARTGSIRQAARAMRMSYRRAWLLVDSLNQSFRERSTSASVGGAGGGGVELHAIRRGSGSPLSQGRQAHRYARDVGVCNHRAQGHDGPDAGRDACRPQTAIQNCGQPNGGVKRFVPSKARAPAGTRERRDAPGGVPTSFLKARLKAASIHSPPCGGLGDARADGECRPL